MTPKVLFNSLVFFLLSSMAFSQKPIIYKLDMSNIQHHELKISVVFEELDTDLLEVRMPDASPGRYAEHAFAKNVYEEKAYDKKEKVLEIRRKTPQTWTVEPRNGYVKFEYILYGNYGDGTYTGIDARKVHMNMPATFVYGADLSDRPIHLQIDLSDHPTWTVATQLVKEDEGVFSALNYYYFYDSPTMVGEIDWRRWEVGDQLIEIAMMHEGRDEELNKYTEWVRLIVAEEAKVYDGLPEFDYKRYTFLMSYNPWIHRDGMEHRNSTVCSSSGNLAKNAEQIIGTVSHEFFHAWNVERIRPASLEPFDFDGANLSGELWFAEGFTSYYDDLILCRAGIRTPEAYVTGLTETMNYVLNNPARNIRTPIQMSYNAPFVDAATVNDETNYSNNFISYYSYGEVLGLGLDLLLRSTFEDITLDDYMKYVWENYGKPEIPYTIPDLEKALSEVTNDKKFAESFFTNYIYDSKLPDFRSLLEKFGVVMIENNPYRVYFGYVNIDDGILKTPVTRGTAFYNAGVEQGDKILNINGQSVTSNEEFKNTLLGLEVGKKYVIEYKQLYEKKLGEFTGTADPSFRITYLSDNELTEEQINKRNTWLKIQ